ASFFAGPLSCENAATATLVPIVKLDFVGLCRALDLVGLCHIVGLRRGSFRSKLAASPTENTPINSGASVAERPIVLPPVRRGAQFYGTPRVKRRKALARPRGGNACAILRYERL